MTFSKFNVQFTHADKAYNVMLYDAKEFPADEVTSKINVNGRTYAVADESRLPPSVKKVFESLQGNSFSSEKELLNKIEAMCKDSKFEGLSLTTRVYNLSNQALLGKQNVESEDSIKLRNQTYADLKSCDPANNNAIAKILQSSKCSLPILFDIADKIEVENAELAHAVRTCARPFNLELSLVSICQQIKANYFNEAIVKMCIDYIERQWKEGAYEKTYDVEEFTAIITRDLREITHDDHFELVLKSEDVQQAETTSDDMARKKEIQKAEKLKELQSVNFGFGKLKFLEGDVCLLEINKMADPNESFDGRLLALEKAKSILEEIRKAKPAAVIFDLRNNHGGSPYMSELLCSYFNGPDILLSRFVYKVPPKAEELSDFPTEPCKTWAYDRLPKEERMLDTPIYILTSKGTFSAAEDVVCHFKALERATVIGETTGGGTNPPKLFDAGQKFYIAIPIGTVVIPYGKNWDGTGITPHIQAKKEEALTKTMAIIATKQRTQSLLDDLLDGSNS